MRNYQMSILDFYDILDKELEQVIENNPLDERLHKDQQNRKSYAFLIWFLKFYGQHPIHNLFITEGKDDNSCDIIFSNVDSQQKKIFYIVQSKWRSRKNCQNKIDSTAFKATLNDFKIVYHGRKNLGKNEPFNKKYTEFQEHLADNGEIKFIYLALRINNPSIKDNQKAFEQEIAPLEIIDIERLKRDYIEFQYKKFKINNPLEYQYEPTNEKVELPIEQLGIQNNYLTIIRPFESYILLVRPKTIHDLFEKYGFKLFHENVRNPLLESFYNQRIEKPLKNESDFFWYYNNGITAITERLPEKIHATAQKITLQGFQVINGAQTLYSIYHAYKNARNGKQETIHHNALISLRIIRSSVKEINWKITRFTNSQNPMYDRDFMANEPVQIRLQEESFKTNYWYSRRRGEFRLIPEKIQLIDNEEAGLAYLAFYLQRPFDIFSAKETNRNLIFVSQKEEKEGLYESVFNENTVFADILASHLWSKKFYELEGSSFGKGPFSKVIEDLLFVITQAMPSNESKELKENREVHSLLLLCMSKHLLKTYISYKYNDKFPLSKFIIQEHEKEGEGVIFEKIFKLLKEDKFGNFVFKTPTEAPSTNSLIDSLKHYQTISKTIIDTQFDISLLDAI